VVAARCAAVGGEGEGPLFQELSALADAQAERLDVHAKAEEVDVASFVAQTLQERRSALAAAVVLLVILFLLVRSRLGASLQAIRDDEDAAASVGVRVLLGKGVLFVLAGAGCTAAGTVILAWQLSVPPLGPDSIFGVNWSAKMIFMVLVGGLGTFEGPIVGAIVLFLLQTYVSNAGVWYFVMLGSIAIAVALFLPRGLWGAVQDRFNLQLLPVGYRLRR